MAQVHQGQQVHQGPTAQQVHQVGGCNGDKTDIGAHSLARVKPMSCIFHAFVIAGPSLASGNPRASHLRGISEMQYGIAVVPTTWQVEPHA